MPGGPLISDSAANLYGTTYNGGGSGCNGYGCGTVFKLAPDGTETVLYSFCSLANCTDGSNPSGGLISDSAGNLYGATSWGGASVGGTVFKIAPDGTETVLYSFPYFSEPIGKLVADRQGNLYGATYRGGNTCSNFAGCGTIFKLAPDGTETVLHSFQKKNGDGHGPNGGLIAINGYLYGTTLSGGGSSNCGTNHKGVPYGCGTVFTVQK